MGGFSTDLRFALRALVGKPAFVVLAVVLLGIGTSAMTFTVVNDARSGRCGGKVGAGDGNRTHVISLGS